MMKINGPNEPANERKPIWTIIIYGDYGGELSVTVWRSIGT